MTYLVTAGQCAHLWALTSPHSWFSFSWPFRVSSYLSHNFFFSFSFWFLETGFLCVRIALAVLKLTLKVSLLSSHRSACFCLLSVGIKGIYHHHWTCPIVWLWICNIPTFQEFLITQPAILVESLGRHDFLCFLGTLHWSKMNYSNYSNFRGNTVLSRLQNAYFPFFFFGGNTNFVLPA